MPVKQQNKTKIREREMGAGGGGGEDTNLKREGERAGRQAERQT